MFLLTRSYYNSSLCHLRMERDTTHQQMTRTARERIHVLHLVNGWRANDVVDPDDVLMFEAQEDFDLSQGALAVRLVLKRADLLDGHADLVVPVVGRAASLKRERERAKKKKKQEQTNS